MKIKRHVENALTWGELADFYDSKHTGRRARTLPMDTVYQWAEKQPEIEVDDGEGLLFWRKHETNQL